MSRIESEAVRMDCWSTTCCCCPLGTSNGPLEREAVDLVAIAGDTVMAAPAAHPDRTVEVR